MRLLIYGMESSGASAFCYFLAQRPDCVGIVDVWSRCLAPQMAEVDVPIVAKVTTNTVHSVDEHARSFSPDKLILFVRNPIANYRSLVKYRYANKYGSWEEKFRQFDAEFATIKADLVVRYEDFVARDGELLNAVCHLGWPCSGEYYEMSRSLIDVQNFNCAVSPWLRREFRHGWGLGNVREGNIREGLNEEVCSDDLAEQIRELAPNLCRYYGYL